MARLRRDREPETPFDQVDNVREKPAKDWPAAPFTGAKWGAALGLAGSMLYLNGHQISGFGVSAYPGDAGVVIFGAMALCAAVGAYAGWLSREPGDK